MKKESENFTVYKSSAGSGKTYTLVKEYLKIALREEEPNRYKNILAITFTNKAAAEMKERVITALTEISSGKKLEGSSHFLMLDLMEVLGFDEKIIQQKCAAILTSMLHNYSDIAISTIDKFVHKIVRTFAYDLQVPVNFNVEMDSDNLLQSAIDILISRVGIDEELTKALVAFTEHKADDEKSWNIANDLKDFSKDLLKEQNIDYIKQLKNLTLTDFFKIRDTLQKFTHAFESKLEAIGNSALKIIRENDIEHKDFAGGEKNGIGKYFIYLSENRNDKFKPSATHLKTVETSSWWAGKASAQAINNISNCKDVLTKLFYEAQKIIEKNYNEYILFTLLQRNIYALSVLNEIEKVIEEIKHENNTVHISEFSKKIAGIVMNEPVPFIYERIGERYKNYLIDEFQDTSVLQWQNFIPLIENSLATQQFNMIVGDGKQAIYRWRGGEVEQFTKLPFIFESEKNPLIKEREQTLERNFKEKFLENNRRSKKEIIQFNNEFFRFSMQKLPPFLSSIYAALEQKFEEKNRGGYVNFHFLNKGEEDYEQHDATCLQVLTTIQKLQADNFKLSDIAILTRNNNNGVILSKYLIENGVNVLSKESLLIATSSSVNFITAALAFLSNANDAIAKATMVEFLMKKEESKNGASSNSNINTYFEERDFFKKYLKNNFSGWNISELLQLPLYELCEEIIRIFKLNEPADPYVQFFLDAVHNYILKYNNNIADFQEWWELKKNSLSIVIPQGLEAVNVMTIHKSKGLEFPVVIFPYANWKPKTGGENIWVNIKNETIPQLTTALVPLSKSLDETEYAELYESENGKKIMDDLNVLYVAFTRPVNRLYIIAEPPDSHKKMAEYYVDFLKEKKLWNDEQNEYEFGSLTKKEEKESHTPTVSVTELMHMISGDWRNQIKLSQQADKMWNMESTTAEKDYGNLIHTALSKINTIEDVSSAIKSMLSEGLISLDERDFLLKKMEHLLQLKSIKHFFEKGLTIKTEAEIILQGGKTYRPDRVIIYPDKAVILDYKTGAPLEKHKTQIRSYGSTLLEMGYSQVEKFLFYTETEKLEMVL